MARILILFLCAGFVFGQTARVQSLRIQVLSTMLTGMRGVGEWGFAAMVEVDGRRILFDTGARPQTVLANARELNVDLAGVTEAILSHNHGDHTIGLVPIRKAFPKSIGTVHVGKGIFYSRPGPEGGERNAALQAKAEFESLGGRFVEHGKPVMLYPGVWLTGPVARKHPERNYGIGPMGKVRGPSGDVEDTIPEDLSLVVDTERGLVVLSGCGHAGIVNTLEHARAVVRTAPIHAALGGWHLFQLPDEKLDWTAGKLAEFGVQNFLGAHCTGVEAVYRIRAKTGLPRKQCSVGAVGAVFELGKDLDPGAIAR